ncbi:MAG: ABC transporter ATP-binding protein [Saprospiraceae bacterium]|nr:ABC transporter ATP-binding protein [Saprospiraceae bacterium]
MNILSIQNLTKEYGVITAVNNLSLEIKQGEIYGLLGPNGSGKTTTLGMILGIIHPKSGHYEWFEGEYKEHDARKRIGTLLETPNFYPYMNAIQNLEIVAIIKKAKNVPYDDLLKLVNLYHRKTSPFKAYSLGMKQRLAIAAALIGDPDVLIFDEPTNGLDPQGIAEVRETIREIASRGKTIIMASHILDEVEKICTHVAIIKNGNLLATGTVGSIISSDKQIEVAAENNEYLQLILERHPKIFKMKLDNNILTLSTDEEVTSGEINKICFENDITLTHLMVKKKSLEAEFLEITS